MTKNSLSKPPQKKIADERKKHIIEMIDSFNHQLLNTGFTYTAKTNNYNLASPK